MDGGVERQADSGRGGAWRLMRRAFAFGLVQMALVALVLVTLYTPTKSNMIFPVTHAKHARAAAVPSPRVLLTGGSAMLYSFDTPAFEDEIGAPAVNMGIVGSLRLGYMLREIEDLAREGDLVVLAIEYALYVLVENDATPLVMVQMVEQRPENARYVPRDMSRRILDTGLQQHLQTAVRSSFQGASNADWVETRSNAFGELVFHRDLEPEDDALDQDAIPFRMGDRRIDRALAMINAACARIRARGGTPVLAYQPVPRSQYERERDRLEWFHAELLVRADADVLGEPGDMVFDDDLFYDSGAHLRAGAPEGRARRMARQIRAWGGWAIPGAER